MRWQLRLIVVGVVLAILAAAGFAAYRWGYRSAEADLASARETAVRHAVSAERSRAAQADAEARSQERAQLHKLRQRLAAVQAKDARTAAVQAEEKGKVCLDAKALTAYRNY